ncbi:MAG: hypothetical protein Q4F40_11045, partial [Akkermansia sp.]|nr:hypothetical protein [Akkermansia sp.]
MPPDYYMPPRLASSHYAILVIYIPPHQLAACGEFFTMAGTAILHNGAAVLHYRPQAVEKLDFEF